MIPKAFIAVTAQQVSKNPIGIEKLEVTLNANATAGLFVQIHDAEATPAEGAVPVKFWPAAECAYKEFKRGELQLAFGCYICLSTTAGTKTLAVGGNDKMDILEVELVSQEHPDTSITTIAGDLLTPVTGLQVWSEATGQAGRKSLLSVEVDGSLLITATQFIQIFATDAVNPGDVPLLSRPIAVAEVRTGAKAFRFGNRGREVFSIDSSNAATKRYGCTVKISSTAATYTACTGTAAIRAKYRTSP